MKLGPLEALDSVYHALNLSQQRYNVDSFLYDLYTNQLTLVLNHVVHHDDFYRHFLDVKTVACVLY
jgi:hypothetical protein